MRWPSPPAAARLCFVPSRLGFLHVSLWLRPRTSAARLGEAGPPVYLVLQAVNYTHPSTAAAVTDVVTQLSTLTAYIQPPFASWVGDVS